MKELEKNLRKNSKKIQKLFFLFSNKMESLQKLSDRALAKKNFNENFFHKKLMCHWEIRKAKKQQIFEFIKNYENLCCEIGDILDEIFDSVINYFLPEIQWIYVVGNDSKNSNEFLQILEKWNKAESEIKKLVQKKRKN